MASLRRIPNTNGNPWEVRWRDHRTVETWSFSASTEFGTWRSGGNGSTVGGVVNVDTEMKMIRRPTVMLAMLSVLAIAAALPASAKIPPFEVDVTVQEDTALIRVSFPFDSSDGFHPTDLDGLLAVYPSNDLDERQRPLMHDNSIAVDLEWVGELGWYEGRVEIEEAGSWTVVPFPTSVRFDPDFPSHREYPTPVGFEIPASDRSALWVGGVLILLTLGGGLLFWSRP